MKRFLLLALLAIMLLLVWSTSAMACPTCKNDLDGNYVQAYGWSIVFMMSMPFLILGSLATYMYYEICRARRQQPSRDSVALAQRQRAAGLAPVPPNAPG